MYIKWPACRTARPTHPNPKPPPLAGVKVVEFTHMVMGPSVGVILADLGAEVIKVEPIGGDPTRRLLGSGAGYFPMFNRNKRSVCLDLKSPEGLVMARRLVDAADVMIENFRPGTAGKAGPGTRQLQGEQSRPDRLRGKGLPVRTL